MSLLVAQGSATSKSTHHPILETSNTTDWPFIPEIEPTALLQSLSHSERQTQPDRWGLMEKRIRGLVLKPLLRCDAPCVDQAARYVLQCIRSADGHSSPEKSTKSDTTCKRSLSIFDTAQKLGALKPEIRPPENLPGGGISTPYTSFVWFVPSSRNYSEFWCTRMSEPWSTSAGFPWVGRHLMRTKKILVRIRVGAHRHSWGGAKILGLLVREPA